MADTGSITLRAIGRVESPLTDPHGAPRQPDEGAPSARVVSEPEFAAGLRDLRPGEQVILITWLHLAPRDVLEVHPRGDGARPLTGVFSTRSPARPNPIGLHEVEITAVDGNRVGLRHLEAVAGTPVIDIKPLLACRPSQR